LGFGAVKHHEILKEIMDDYNDIPFILENGEYDLFPCPVRNTTAFLNRGLVQNNTLQNLDNIIILPTEWLCPIDYESGQKKITDNTLSIHHFSATWMNKFDKKKHRKNIEKYKKINTIHNIKHLPNFVLMKILGDNRYNKLKSKLKK
jgi:predicted Ser/Thr protein kinase